MRRPHQTTSSLEESTYEVLGDVLSSDDEDDAHTASLTSGTSVDGAATIDSGSDSDEENDDIEPVHQSDSIVTAPQTTTPSTSIVHIERYLQDLSNNENDEDEDEDEEDDGDKVYNEVNDKDHIDNDNEDKNEDMDYEGKDGEQLKSKMTIWFDDMDIYMAPSIQHLKVACSLVAFLVMILVATWAYCHVTINITFAKNSLPAPLSSNASSLSPTLVPSSIASQLREIFPPSPSPVPKAKAKSKNGVTETSLGSPMQTLGSPKQTLAANESAEFVPYLLGEDVIILQPPTSFSRLKKQPNINIDISRGKSSLGKRHIKAEIQSLPYGLYAISVDREQAYGILNVTVYTTSKPKIKQHFQFNFGSPWLKMSRWAATAEHISLAMRNDAKMTHRRAMAMVNKATHRAFKMAAKAHKNARIAAQHARAARRKAKKFPF